MVSNLIWNKHLTCLLTRQSVCSSTALTLSMARPAGCKGCVWEDSSHAVDCLKSHSHLQKALGNLSSQRLKTKYHTFNHSSISAFSSCRMSFFFKYIILTVIYMCCFFSVLSATAQHITIKFITSSSHVVYTGVFLMLNRMRPLICSCLSENIWQLLINYVCTCCRNMDFLNLYVLQAELLVVHISEHRCMLFISCSYCWIISLRWQWILGKEVVCREMVWECFKSVSDMLAWQQS